MTQQGSDQGASATHSSRPAGPPAAPVAAARGAMTVGGVLTVAGILLLFVVFAVGIFSLQYCFNALGRATDGRRRRGGGGAAGGNNELRGVDPEVLRSLPVTVYRREAKDPSAAASAAECAVCLAELEDGEEARFLPRCGHGFHAGCVDLWLASHSTCPLCRLTVAEPDAPPPLPPAAPEPANYPANLPPSVLLGLSDSDQSMVVTAMPAATDGSTNPFPGTTGALVIEIPGLTVPTTAPLDGAKSPGSARLRSIRRLWSFGRHGAGPSSSCSCAGAGEGADVEQGISVSDWPSGLPPRR
ncbi:hypothetical protein ACP70R_026810 [Stipagrostis hirtigluma subsp. patula]